MRARGLQECWEILPPVGRVPRPGDASPGVWTTDHGSQVPPAHPPLCALCDLCGQIAQAISIGPQRAQRTQRRRGLLRSGTPLKRIPGARVRARGLQESQEIRFGTTDYTEHTENPADALDHPFEDFFRVFRVFRGKPPAQFRLSGTSSNRKQSGRRKRGPSDARRSGREGEGKPCRSSRGLWP